MRLSVCHLLLLVGACYLLACEDPSVPPQSTDLSGLYIGEAAILIEETRLDSAGLLTELVLLDTLIIDTIRVSAISVEDSIFYIDRASSFFTSFYEIEGEKSFAQDYNWYIRYEYDKEWISQVQFKPSQDSLHAYMLVRDIFSTPREDAAGSTLYTYVQRKVYTFRASQQ